MYEESQQIAMQFDKATYEQNAADLKALIEKIEQDVENYDICNRVQLYYSLATAVSNLWSIENPDKQKDNDTIQKTYVQISARNLSLEAVDSYPQKLLKVIRNEDTIKTVLISTFSEYEEPDRVTRVKNAPYNPTFKYPSAISRFLEATQYVNSSSENTAYVADTLFNGKEKYCLDIIKKALAFSKRITFDRQLAQALDKGQSMTVPSDEVLQSMTGTCSEATNVFLALMRHMGIPARMVVGYCYLPEKGINSSHAWAECYIEGAGWWGVDPQNGSPAVSYIG